MNEKRKNEKKQASIILTKALVIFASILGAFLFPFAALATGTIINLTSQSFNGSAYSCSVPGMSSGNFAIYIYNTLGAVVPDLQSKADLGGLSGATGPVTPCADTVTYGNIVANASFYSGMGYKYMAYAWQATAGDGIIKYFLIDITSGNPIPTSADDSTRFLSVAPPNATTTPTNDVVLGFDVHTSATLPTTCNSNVFSLQPDGTFATTTCDFFLTLGTRAYGSNTAYQNSTFQLTVNGYFAGDHTGSTTRTLSSGLWEASYVVQYGDPNIGSGDVIVATTTRFAVVTSGQSATTTNDFFNPPVAQIGNAQDCQGLSLFTVPCFQYLIIPTPSQMRELNDALTVSLLSKIPFSYVVRATEILNASTTVPLPALSFTMPTSTGYVLPGAVFSFNPWVYGYSNATSAVRQLVNPSTGQDVWQIMQPLISTIVYLTLILKIISDLTRVHVKEQTNL